MSDERQNRPILSADKIARQKICRVSCKNRPILSADEITRFCRPR